METKCNGIYPIILTYRASDGANNNDYHLYNVDQQVDEGEDIVEDWRIHQTSSIFGTTLMVITTTTTIIIIIIIIIVINDIIITIIITIRWAVVGTLRLKVVGTCSVDLLLVVLIITNNFIILSKM